MTERRCLYCHHWGLYPGETRNSVEADERIAHMRYGPNVGIGGRCEHPDDPHPLGTNSIATCERWEAAKPVTPKS
jgi:hypothetical protein